MTEHVNITPNPRILRTLGEIPFAAWQCIAELVDNSMDSLGKPWDLARPDDDKRIIVSWSRDNVAEGDRALEVKDTGPGMSLDVLQKCVAAGYSTNDPISFLGLFGMGFNIATARLGEKTLVMSSEEGTSEWVGVEIDFDHLIGRGTYDAPVIRLPKQLKSEHGTLVRVSKLKPGLFNELRNRGREIKRQLETIYSPILNTTDIEVLVQGTRLQRIQHCVWGTDRYVTHKGEPVPAVIEIDENLGIALFDTDRNRYVTESEENEYKTFHREKGALPKGIVQRERRIHGWLGIQRYAEPEDFGIDFIRNGRKILIGDTSLFGFRNPMTGRTHLEYPKELGTTVGGRIVGEIHVDHIPPTYQKTDFDRTDASWEEMVMVLRGAGPALPTMRKTLEYTAENTSALARLINAYQRCDAGTRCLAAPNDLARKWAIKYREGDQDFRTDGKWWQAAIEADRTSADKGAKKAPMVDHGASSDEDIAKYVPEAPLLGPASGTLRLVEAPTTLTPFEELKSRSRKIETYSSEYSYEKGGPAFSVTVWEVTKGRIGVEGQEIAVKFFQESINCDFFFDPKHQFLLHYPISFRELLLFYLADRFKIRNRQEDIVAIFAGLFESNFSNVRIEYQRIQDEARTLFDRLRDSAIELLQLREQEVIDFVFESAGEVEDTMPGLIINTQLVSKFQSRSPGCIDAIISVPSRTLVRLVDRFPEEFFDGKFFKSAYSIIELPDSKSTERLRSISKDRILSYLKDALWSISENKLPFSDQRLKEELQRCEHSLRFLRQEIGT